MLYGRKQFVEYNNVKSPHFNTPTGVTQGPNLGPFILMCMLTMRKTSFDKSFFVMCQ